MNPITILARLLPRHDDHACPHWQALQDARAELAAAEHASEVDGQTIRLLRQEGDNNRLIIDRLRGRISTLTDQRDRAVIAHCLATGTRVPDGLHGKAAAAVADEAETFLRRMREGL